MSPADPSRPAPGARPQPESTARRRSAAHGRGESTRLAALPRAKTLTTAAAALVLLLGVGGVGFYFASDRVSDLVSSWLAAPANPEPVGSKHADRLAPGSQPDRVAFTPRERIIEFVNAYDGGDCFFITPQAVEDDNAVLDGLGSSVAPFEILDDEFKRKNGFEPSIGVHQVMAEQCPAVSFLFHTRRQRSVAPRLDAVTAGLKEGGPLTGSISNFGAGAVELLLVADDGYVRNLTTLLKPGGSARNFTIGIHKTSPGPPRPQILMAVASSKPLEALKVAPDGTLAGQVFPRALAEASRSGQTPSVSAKYFMLEK